MIKPIPGFFMLATSVSLILSSCASIISKSSYPISINSNPTGATLSITDKKSKEIYKGQTPATVTLKSGAGYFSRAEYQVKLTSPGFAEQIHTIHFKLNGWYFGNLLIGGVIGMLIVDPLTGAMWKLETPPINVTMHKSGESTAVPTLEIIDIATIPEAERENLVRIN